MTEVDVPLSMAARSVYVRTAGTLVVADTHLGRAATSSVDAPVDDSGDVHSRLEDGDPFHPVLWGGQREGVLWFPPPGE